MARLPSPPPTHPICKEEAGRIPLPLPPHKARAEGRGPCQAPPPSFPHPPRPGLSGCHGRPPPPQSPSRRAPSPSPCRVEARPGLLRGASSFPGPATRPACLAGGRADQAQALLGGGGSGGPGQGARLRRRAGGGGAAGLTGRAPSPRRRAEGGRGSKMAAGAAAATTTTAAAASVAAAAALLASLPPSAPQRERAPRAPPTLARSRALATPTLPPAAFPALGHAHPAPSHRRAHTLPRRPPLPTARRLSPVTHLALAPPPPLLSFPLPPQ